MDGLLYKWTNYINGWQQRYFVLHDGILSYYICQSDVDTGSKGTFKVSSCELIVHPTDACRFEILTSGTERYYLKAVNPQERQKWIVALGSCKAGTVNADERQRMQQAEQLIDSKRSELRINRDLLFQQVNGICGALRSKVGDNPEILASINSLKATCDTFLSTTDELMSLLNIGRSKRSANLLMSNVGGVGCDSLPLNTALSLIVQNGRPNPHCPSLFPSSPPIPPVTPSPPADTLALVLTPNEASLTRPENTDNTAIASPRGAFKSSGGLAPYNKHLRELRLHRLYPNFLSSLEFSFEDFSPSPTFSAIEFLASIRSTLKFFGALASVDEATGAPILARLGSLQTVYADVLGNVVRLELAVRNMATSSTPTTTTTATANANATTTWENSDVRERSLRITLKDIIAAEQRVGQCKIPGSAYFAMLWLARALNFVAEFMDLLFLRNSCDTAQSISQPPNVQEVATIAYTNTLRDFHDWSIRGTVAVIVKAIPTFEKIRNALLLIDDAKTDQLIPSAEALAQLHLDVERFVEALRRCLQTIHRMFIQHGFDAVFSSQTAS